MKIEGQCAIVTGGGSGLGAETARELARRGARVTVLDINGDAAAATGADIGGFGVRCDVVDGASVEAALAAATERHGPARLLFNIAGIASARRIVGKDGTPAPLADLECVVRVNLMDELPQTVRESLAASIPFPKRLGKPQEFAQLALAIVENSALNGEVIRIDGALRMAPR